MKIALPQNDEFPLIRLDISASSFQHTETFSGLEAEVTLPPTMDERTFTVVARLCDKRGIPAPLDPILLQEGVEELEVKRRSKQANSQPESGEFS